MTVQYRICNKEFVEDLLKTQPAGKNTSFLNAAHSLWYRFKNYDSNPPIVLFNGKEPAAFVFRTISNRSKYINLYEIVTLEGKEGQGLATKIWQWTMAEASSLGMKRLKISCTTTSVSWHKRNGLIFWAVDPSGSLRSDQPLFPTVEDQIKFRELALRDPSIALPDQKVIEQFKLEGYESFGEKKKQKILEAIETVKPYWFRDELFKNNASLDAFM